MKLFSCRDGVGRCSALLIDLRVRWVSIVHRREKVWSYDGIAVLEERGEGLDA